MSVEVVMPQMGESITEGTVSKWLKSLGDKIGKDEPILEISTDKVDAEVPSPGAGILLEIRHKEGETVEVGTVVAVIGEEGEQGANGGQQTAISSQQSAVSSQQSEVSSEQSVIGSQPDSANLIEAAGVNSTGSANPVTPTNATEIVMPQMGESITEGTVSKWLKSVGDKIEKDEPLLEISTDKVDAEVPSPAEGTLLEIKVNEGETVEVGAVVALVGAEGAVSAPSPSQAENQTQIAAVESTAEAANADIPSVVAAKQEVAATVSVGNGKSSGSNGQPSVEDLRRTKSSPLVRNIAKEHGIDISRISGSGMSGRVTKNDIISFIETGAALRPQDLLRVGSPVRSVSGAVTSPAFNSQPSASPVGDRVEKMSVMRKKIAEHMTLSKQTSAHVTSVYEIDMTNVAKFREKNKAEFQSRYGTKLTYMPFIFQTVTNAIRKFPVVNAQVSGENIVYKGDINLGMAVALDWGLIVPVIKNADSLSLSGLAMAANDLADRARSKKLSPDEVTNGTFTITNPGVFGGLFGTPIINQPQVAILCVGTIEKRPKVYTSSEGDDYIAIRHMAYFALTYDHRIVDGADAERFLAFMKEFLEAGQFNF
ncbi:MAG: 2-oxoglutarate dehydrogenase, E2 component, dihydrolipoamide succinyltransferase [Pyrinomonadaceae bacterium]|nr:2-oxoglutarate dehydrogenase, E2 component, dihydrolipoamide succinyltransferase [Blastocatellia bacterium]MDQ3221670.1 2-oxoglutarate dehydrogenase, E2 component, dihydrolipoamide succinyltransferase [Acidobacteriota bacterium]